MTKLHFFRGMSFICLILAFVLFFVWAVLGGDLAIGLSLLCALLRSVLLEAVVHYEGLDYEIDRPARHYPD
jgi:hypothetical protein